MIFEADHNPNKITTREVTDYLKSLNSVLTDQRQIVEKLENDFGMCAYAKVGDLHGYLCGTMAVDIFLDGKNSSAVKVVLSPFVDLEDWQWSPVIFQLLHDAETKAGVANVVLDFKVKLEG